MGSVCGCPQGFVLISSSEMRSRAWLRNEGADIARPTLAVASRALGRLSPLDRESTRRARADAVEGAGVGYWRADLQVMRDKMQGFGNELTQITQKMAELQQQWLSDVLESALSARLELQGKDQEAKMEVGDSKTSRSPCISQALRGEMSNQLAQDRSASEDVALVG